jgi:Tol biopolymer transport system component
MQTQLHLAQRRVFGVPAMLILVALLVAAVIAGTVAIGSQLSRQRSLPPPFGVADNGLLAVEIDGTISLVRPDGTVLRQLELPFDGLSGTTFSRDGARLAAWSMTDPGRVAGTELALIVANADGSGAVDVDPANRFSNPGVRIAWSPDGRQIAFSADAGRLYVADLAAGTIRSIGAAGTARQDPAWSPDGRLAYRCQPPEGLRLCVMNADGTGERILPTSPGTDYAFQGSTWSPDGGRIAYYIDDVDGTGGWDVATLDLATGTERILTRDTAAHTIYPVWAPDGGHVIFLTQYGPGVVRDDGSGLRILENRSCVGLEPSPDGRFVTCLETDSVLLWPIAGGEPTSIPLGGAGSGFSWQRVSN